MNKFLLILIFFISICFLLIKPNKDVYFEPKGFAIDNNNKIILEINSKLREINNFYSEIVIKQGVLEAKGFLAYKKPINFIMKCDSLLLKIEIGCNQDMFWFFSSNIKPKALYYCSIEDIQETRLKKLFYPEVIKSFLSINEIKDYKLIKQNEIYYIIQKIKISNEYFDKITIIENNKITEHKFCKDKNVLLEIKILKFQNIKDIDLPKVIRINWIEENIEQEWILNNTNLNNDFSNWQMPNYKNKINLKNY